MATIFTKTKDCIFGKADTCGFSFRKKVSVFHGRKCSLRGIPRFMEESIPKLTELSYLKKSCSSKQNWERVFVRQMLQNGIPRVSFSFCSTERNFELFSLLGNNSEGNFENLPLFLFHGTKFQALRNGSEHNSESCLFCGTAGIPPEQTNLFLSSLELFFLSEISNPTFIF